MSVPVATGLTYDDLSSFPDDHLRRELIDGQLYVSPSPIVRHQVVADAVVRAFHRYLEDHDGQVLFAPMDIVFAEDTVVEPDVLFLTAERWSQVGDTRFIDVVPDLLVEVSSPSTRRLDLIKKRNLYERAGVPEYWFVDLAEDQVDVHRLDHTGHYGQPTSLAVGDVVTCAAAPGFEVAVAAVLVSD